MILKILLTSHKAQVQLWEGEKNMYSREFEVDNNLSNSLLVEIDALLKEYGLVSGDLEKVVCEADEAGFTTTRIGQAIANAYNYGLNGELPMFVDEEE